MCSINIAENTSSLTAHHIHIHASLNTVRLRQNGYLFAGDIFNFLHENCHIWLIFYFTLSTRVQLMICQYWFIKWLGAKQATSHYPHQWRLSLLMHTCVTQLWWIKDMVQQGEEDSDSADLIWTHLNQPTCGSCYQIHYCIFSWWCINLIDRLPLNKI